MSPIRPENLARYPAEWPEIRARIRDRAKNRCELCAVKNFSIGGRDSRGNFHPLFQRHEDAAAAHKLLGTRAWCGSDGPELLLHIFRIVCTVAHLDHTPENCSDDNLRFWCQRCHLHYDRVHHSETAYQTRREGKAAADLFPKEVTAA